MRKLNPTAVITRLFPSLARRAWEYKHKGGVRSYSQEGEDLILSRYFQGSGPGFFVDVGAHDPFRFSNTQLFYLLGWRGVNIDAMPGSMALFCKHRPGDINLELGVGLERGAMPFFIFNEPALNSFDQELSHSRQNGTHKIMRVAHVPVRPLAEVLAGHLPGGEVPSFLTVDVEGRDLDVLRSNDWTAFRPNFVLVECLESSAEDILASAMTAFMFEVGYRFEAKTMNTAFYRAIAKK